MEKYSVLMVGFWGIMFVLKEPNNPLRNLGWVWFGFFALIAILMFVREVKSNKSKKVTEVTL